MNIKNEKTYLMTGAFLLLIAIGIGAFGAHGLKEIVVGKYLTTFKTGSQYHFYHGFGIMFLGLIQRNFPNINLKPSFYCLLGGTILFSFNCYIYAITQAKVFAMIVPIGGVLFMVGWTLLLLKLRKA